MDISSDAGWLDTALAAMTLVQSLMQVRCACAPALDAWPAWNALHAWNATVACGQHRCTCSNGYLLTIHTYRPTAIARPPLQGRWYDDSSLLVLPHFTGAAAAQLAAAGLAHLPQLLQALRAGGKAKQAAAAAIEAAVGQREARDVLAVCERLPVVGVSWQPPALVHRPVGDEDGSSSSGSSASYSIEVELQRLGGKGGSRQSPPRVYAPRFPKARGAARLGSTRFFLVPDRPACLECPRLPKRPAGSSCWQINSSQLVMTPYSPTPSQPTQTMTNLRSLLLAAGQGGGLVAGGGGHRRRRAVCHQARGLWPAHVHQVR